MTTAQPAANGAVPAAPIVALPCARERVNATDAQGSVHVLRALISGANRLIAVPSPELESRERAALESVVILLEEAQATATNAAGSSWPYPYSRDDCRGAMRDLDRARVFVLGARFLLEEVEVFGEHDALQFASHLLGLAEAQARTARALYEAAPAEAA